MYPHVMERYLYPKPPRRTQIRCVKHPPNLNFAKQHRYCRKYDSEHKISDESAISQVVASFKSIVKLTLRNDLVS